MNKLLMYIIYLLSYTSIKVNTIPIHKHLRKTIQNRMDDDYLFNMDDDDIPITDDDNYGDDFQLDDDLFAFTPFDDDFFSH